MKKCAISLICVLFAIALSCGEPPRVIQGTVLEYYSDTKILVISDQGRPGESHNILLTKAEMGAAPSVGDVVRLSCRIENGRLVAIRVMGISTREEHAETE